MCRWPPFCAMPVTKMKTVGYIISNRTSCLVLSLFTKVSLVLSCKLTKMACFQNFLLTQLDFCGNLLQQFNITYLLRVPARLPKEPEQVFNFLSLHNEPEPRPSRKGWSGSGCCVAIFLLPNPAPHLENRMTVCMGYPAITPQGRAGKRRRKGAGKPCRENGAPNVNWSKWPTEKTDELTGRDSQIFARQLAKINGPKWPFEGSQGGTPCPVI